MPDKADKLNQFESYVTDKKIFFNLKVKKSFNIEPIKSFSGLKLAGLAATSLINPKSWAFWERAELLEDKDPNLIQESFLQGTKYTMFPALSFLFGTDAPKSSSFILHFGKNWQNNLKKSNKLPVLLVPGASDNGHRAFADPSYGIPGLNKNTGIAQYLDEQGYPVFALTFSHPQGCNFIQAEQLANAIKRIRKVTGKNKVDIVAHSKGNVPVRMYISNIRRFYLHNVVFNNVRKIEFDGKNEIEKHVKVIIPAKDWMSQFNYDVRRVVQLAAPNKGIDSVFRTFSNTASAYLSKQAPVPFIRYFSDSAELHESIQESIYYEENHPHVNNYFPGQGQLLHRLDEEVPLKTSFFNRDTLEKMYYGGHSKIGDSHGIDYAIAQGGNLIDSLRQKGTSNYVEVATACGTKSILNVTFAGVPIPITYDGVKGDGLLFYVSASDTEGINNSMGVYDFPINHLEMAFHNSICEWIDDVLSH